MMVRLGDVADLIREQVDPSTLDPTTPYIGLDRVAPDGDAEAVLLHQAEAASNKNVFRRGDVLYGRLRPYLRKVALAPCDGVCTTEIFVLRPQRVDARLLRYLLLHPSVVATATSRCEGANLPRVGAQTLEAIEFPLSESLPHQRHIANILDKADAIRRKRREALALTDELLRATFLEMFGDPVTNPRGWPTMPLGELLQGDPQNGMYRPASDYGAGTLIVRIDSYTRTQGIRWQELKRLAADAGEVARYSLHSNDILINRVNTRELVGKAALVEDAPSEPVVFESNMMRVRPDESRVSPQFLLAELNGSRIVDSITKSVKPAVNQASINQGDVLAFSIRVPPMAMQSKFAAVVRSARESAQRMAAGVAEAEALFAALQHRAFRGEL